MLGIFGATQQPLPRIGELQPEPSFAKRIQGNRHVSFVFVFDASSGKTGDNGNGGHPGGEGGIGETKAVQGQQGVSTFNLGIKCKDPPMFHGRESEDVATWISKVSNFFYLTGPTERQ